MRKTLFLPLLLLLAVLLILPVCAAGYTEIDDRGVLFRGHGMEHGNPDRKRRRAFFLLSPDRYRVHLSV